MHSYGGNKGREPDFEVSGFRRIYRNPDGGNVDQVRLIIKLETAYEGKSDLSSIEPSAYPLGLICNQDIFYYFSTYFKETEMHDLETVIKSILEFRDERDWKQFHNSKDLALAISIEASELNELFLWKKSTDVEGTKIKDELADILIYCIILAKNHDLDILDIIEQKIAKNASNYPIDKAKGMAKKYNEL